MKFAIFGLTVSTLWGNDHAQLWRGLISALLEQGHRIVFFEKDLPAHASHRDLTELPPGAELILYPSWEEILPRVRRELSDSEVGLVTSACPDGVAASRRVLESTVPVRCFYDLDTPITLGRALRGEPVEYIPSEGLGHFDVVLSATGGLALRALSTLLGARCVAPLYGGVDPGVRYPVPPKSRYQGDLSYLGSYADEPQEVLERLFLEPARRSPQWRFVISGAQDPAYFSWTPNMFFVRHLPSEEHPAFYCSSLLTLNVTREPMAGLGYCPSLRLFEAAACGVPVLTDDWMGLDTFFRVEEEILVARSTEDTLSALSRSPEELARIGRAARERALTEHSTSHRAQELVELMETAISIVAEAEPTFLRS